MLTRIYHQCLPAAALITLCLPLLTLNSGCRAWALFADPHTETVAAEYPFLKDKNVLILVWADMDTLFDFGNVRWEVAEYVKAQLEATSDLGNLTVVPPKPIAEMQSRELNWDEVHPAEHGERFRANRVLWVELTEYGTREPDSPHLYRGRISANLRIYDTSYGTDHGPTFETSLTTIFPPDGPGHYGMDDTTVRRAVMEQFAIEVAGKFHDREVEVR